MAGASGGESSGFKEYLANLNPLLEEQMLAITKREMENRGFVYSETDSDFIVWLMYENNRMKTYVPPRTIYVSEYEPGERYIGFYGDRAVDIQSEGKWVDRPYTVDGHAALLYFKHLVLFFRLPGVERPFWIGEAETLGEEPDIRDLAPYLLEEILDEFPEESGKPARRTVEIRR